jgi:amino acid adenylation domain-containing protein
LLSQLLDHQRVENRDLDAEAPAIMDGGRSLTWAEYVERVARASGALVAAGVRPGDRVALRLAKSIESFVMTHAVLRAGAVMVPVDPSAPNPLAASVLADSEASAFVTDASESTIADIIDGLALRCVVVLGRDDAVPLAASTRLLTDRDVWAAPPGELVEVDATAAAYIIYTSGSTGRPKGIVHSHQSALSYASAAAELYGLAPQDRLANIAALHFDQSTFELYSAPLAGSSVVVVPEPLLRFPASLTALLATQLVTVVYSVPSLFRQITSRGALDDRDLTTLRWVLFGGESYPPGQLAALMDKLPGTRFSNVYGPAEVNQCMFHHLSSAPTADAAVPIGRAWPAATVDVVDPEDLSERVEAGTAGVLIVRTPTMMTGYWNRPDLTAASMLERPDGQGGSQRWYVTGDLVVERDDGELEFLGRVDNQVKVRGHRIELEAVDDALGDIAGVRSGVAVVRRVASGDDTVVALVVPTRSESGSGSEADRFADGVIAELRRRLPHAAVPAEVVLVDDLPRTGTGKIDRRAAERLVDSP